MNALMQGLWIAYLNARRRQPWRTDDANGTAKGNPLIGHADFDTLRHAESVMLARYGFLPRKVSTFMIEHVCSHAENLWSGSSEIISPMDVELQAVLVIRIHLGLRYDEVYKIRMENVSIVSRTCRMDISESIENSTVNSDYSMTEWPGNYSIQH